MKRLILLVALVMAMAVLAPAAFADDDGPEADDTEMTEKDPSAAQERKAKMIADYFSTVDGGATRNKIDFVTDTHAGDTFGRAVGWGVMFRVMQCGGGGIAALELANSEGGWAVGQLCKDYEGASETPKNFGQLQKENKPEKPEKATPPGQLKKADKTDS